MLANCGFKGRFALLLAFSRTSHSALLPAPSTLIANRQFSDSPNITSSNYTCVDYPGEFLPNGTFCSTSNSSIAVTCPQSVGFSLQCPALDYCFLPNGLNTERASTNRSDAAGVDSSCSSSLSILSILGVISVVEASSTLLQGHDRVRNKLFKLKIHAIPSPDAWTPLSGILSALSTFVSQVLISAITSWASNKHLSFAGVLGMWTLRPRSAFIALILVRIIGWTGFKATMFDIIVSESMLDVIALPFALTFLLSAQNSDGETCGLRGYQPNDGRIGLAHSSFGWSTAAGVLSSIVLAQFLIMSFKDITAEDLAEKDEEDQDVAWYDGWKRRFVNQEKRQILPIIVAMGTLISNWVLWGQFMSLQGNNYCESANGIATLAISILHQILVPLLRACFGQGPSEW